MDSLLANYASSDEDDERREPPPPPPAKNSSENLFTSVTETELRGNLRSISTSIRGDIFKSLPPPKSSTASSSSPLSSALPPSSSAAKRVVQIRPPMVISSIDPDADDEAENRSPKKTQSAPPSSIGAFLSSIPAPKHSATLGTASSASGSSRRLILETDNTETHPSEAATAIDSAPNYDYTYYGDAGANLSAAESYNAADYSASAELGYVEYDHSYQSTMNAFEIPGKRGRKDVIPTAVIEVKQEELMKNRPREDQAKLTGIAFGPSYQAASTKGKPSKLHKRKHQIGSLYFDMRQKESELAERRARGLMSKAQTQGKYGW